MPRPSADRSTAFSVAVATGIRIGAIGGLVAIAIATQGMIQTFSVRNVIAELLSMSESLLLIAFFGTSYMAVRRASLPPLPTLLTGGVSGLVAGLLLLGFIWLGSAVDLGVVLINATPELYDLVTFGKGLAAGSLTQLAVAVGAGLGAAVLYLMPPRARRAVAAGLVAVIALGYFQDWLLRTAGNTPQALRAPLKTLTSFVYSRNGLTVTSAITILAVVAALTFLWATQGPRIRAGVNKMPPSARRPVQLIVFALLALLMLLLPALLGIENSEILDNVGMFMLMGLGLNIVVGFAGLLDLGYVAFFAIGAYTVGVLTSPELGRLPIMQNWWPALPFGLAAALIAGVLLGVPVLKMRGDYLAIVTLGFGEIIRLVAGSDLLKGYLGGAQGTRNIARPDIGSFFEFGPHNFTLPLLGRIDFKIQHEFFYLFLAACLLAILIAVRLRSSRLGRAWMAVREDEDVAQAMGVNLVSTKLLAFGMGALFGGLGGAIFASKLGSIFPHSFNFLISINVLSVIIVGGMGSIPGVIVGALALVGLPELTREFAEFRYLLYGGALVVMMLTRPEGLWPEPTHRRELHEVHAPEGEPSLEGLKTPGGAPAGR
jgi:branched-chain amino acid transport system permease protein